MDDAAFLDAVREANDTALRRLGSERALVAVTAATLERETVLETAAAAEARAAATFEGWAEDESNDEARAAFDAAAGRERAHLERVVDLAADGTAAMSVDSDPGSDALHDHLRSVDGTLERVGAGLVGRPLVAARTLLQVINFFVNEGESGAADTLRDLRSETEEQARTGASLALTLAADDAARDRATAAAGRAIDVAYEEYAERLSRMGVDPKPVC